MSDFNRRAFLQSITTAAALGAFNPIGLKAASGSDLEKVFAEPPVEASPWIFWYWMNANASKEGITADLEAMKANGIACVYLFTIGEHTADSTLINPPADPLSELWWTLVEHAAAEAARVGLKLAMNACDGWATAGGPWITPALSMQKIVWSEQRVMGGQRFSGKLATPTAIDHYYQDVAVFAFPVPSAWGATEQMPVPTVTTNLPVKDAQSIVTAKDGETTVDTEQPGWIQFKYATPFTLRSVTMFTPDFNPAAQSFEIQASNDGQAFRDVFRLEPPANGWQTLASPWTHSVPETTARFFRFVYAVPPEQPYAEDFNFIGVRRLKLTRMELSSIPRINQFEGKSGATWTLGRRTTDADTPRDVCVPLKQIVDLSAAMNTSGELSWDVPQREWMIMRFGHTTTGSHNDPAGAGQGLECDKFNPEAARVQFNGWFGEAIKRMGPELSGKVLKVFHVDSWECGSQNWSPLFREEFRRRRGYDPLPYLPAMRGVPVESADVSEHFLWDVRRTIADLLGANFYEPMAKMAHEHGCLFTAECTAPTMVGDGMLHYSIVDIPMGEFWLNTVYHDKPNDIRDAVSGAHVYGKPIVQAEAFTEGKIAWDEHPFMLKPLADHNFCDGINRLTLHVYAHQAWPDRAPGVTLSSVGTFFSHTQTWWKPGKVWFDYLRRCQALLQQGQPVTDVCYFTGEDIPSRALLPQKLNPALPAGYKYDSVNRDALLRLASVRDGDVVLLGGARYRVLVMPPDSPFTTPEVTAKVRELVAQGATVSRNLEQVLRDPDVEAGEQVEWVHRKGQDFDVYFLSNQKPAARSERVSFRVSGRVPELWHPDTGRMERTRNWSEERGRTWVEVELDPFGSVFVVFRKTSSAKPQQIMRASDEIAVRGPWTVEFKPGNKRTFEELKSWSSDTDPEVRYFSGTAHYRTTFSVPSEMLHGNNRLFLDLGDVAYLATVRVNGKAIGTAWKPPFSLELTSAVKGGENQLEIEVTNTWKNRLIGDASLPPEKRSAWLLFEQARPKAETPLDPAGLLGPVQIHVES